MNKMVIEIGEKRYKGCDADIYFYNEELTIKELDEIIKLDGPHYNEVIILTQNHILERR